MMLAALFWLALPEAVPVPAVPPRPAAIVASVTTFGRDVVVSQPVSGRVLAAFANVRIATRVSGDVVVWGGNVSFGPEGSVGGNLSVFGGRIEAAGTPPVAGAVSTPGTLLHLYLAEMRRAPWEVPRSATLWGLRLLALAAWLAVALFLLRFLGSPFARAAARAEEALPASVLAGALSIVTIFLAAAAVLGLLPAALSIPAALVLAAVAVAAKIFGMGSLFLLLGQKLTRSVAARGRPAALGAGFAALAAASLLPVVGPLVWSAASILAVGIAFLSRFGSPRYRVTV